MRTYLRLILNWIFDKIFEKQTVTMQSGLNRLKTACPILQKVMNPQNS